MSATPSYWKNDWHVRANNYLGLSQRMLDLEWVDKQTLKGKLPIGYRQTIEKLVPVLEAVFPGKWDIQYDTKLDFIITTNLYKLVEFDNDMYDSY
jgi:hypothetical protein